MKKLLILALIILLTGCSTAKDSISDEEVMTYMETLLEPYIKTANTGGEEEAREVLDEIKATSINVKEELEEKYDISVPAVNDLTRFAETLIKLGSISDDETGLVKGYTDDITNHIYRITSDYLDGEFPRNFAEATGVDSIDDLN